MSANWVQDISEMHKKFRFHESLDFNGDFLRFRQNFLEEEMTELDEAILANNPEAVVDSLIDLCVVAIGTLDLGGIDTQKAWDSVHTANMSKERADNPNRKGSGGFDLIKPAGWNPPSHEGNTGYIALAVQMILKKMDASGTSSTDRAQAFMKLAENVPSHIKTLHEFQEFALSKTHDYDDEHDPEFAHFTYYPSGINDIMYELSKKVKRIRRSLKRMFTGGSKPLTDTLDDSFRDISIYSAIGYNIVNGTLEGQSEDRDMFNREITQ